MNPFYRLRTDPEQVTLVLALLAYGCPVGAIVFAFGLDERTVRNWEHRAGHHCKQIHQHLIEQPRDFGQVQADEIRVKMQKLVVWVAMVIQVSTRLWLGATVGEHRDETLVTELMQRMRACCQLPEYAGHILSATVDHPLSPTLCHSGTLPAYRKRGRSHEKTETRHDGCAKLAWPYPSTRIGSRDC